MRFGLVGNITVYGGAAGIFGYLRNIYIYVLNN